jgi:hypothetical protein
MGDKLIPTSFEKFLPFSDFFDFTFYVHGKAFKVHRVVFAGEFSTQLSVSLIYSNGFN